MTIVIPAGTPIEIRDVVWDGREETMIHIVSK